jgi:4-hydroxybenzoate polyprenyltransferase
MPLIHVARTVRPSPAIIAGIAAAAPAYAVGSDDLVATAVVALSVCIAVMLGFALNDLHDLEKDRTAGRRDKPLVTGQLSIGLVAGIACALFASGVAIALMLSGTRALLAFTILSLLVCAYSPFANRYPSLKAVYTAGLCVTPYAVAQAVLDIVVSPLLYLMGFGFFLFREIAIDATEIEWDKRASYHTIAVYIGARLARAVGWGGMLLIAVAMYALAKGKATKAAVIASFGTLMLAFVISFRFPIIGLNLTRIPMLIAAIALPFIMLE